ncbi:MAG: hypothetical protein ACRD35_08535, partial [Candidatus Acidiferrales bacterium]
TTLGEANACMVSYEGCPPIQVRPLVCLEPALNHKVRPDPYSLWEAGEKLFGCVECLPQVPGLIVDSPVVKAVVEIAQRFIRLIMVEFRSTEGNELVVVGNE